MEVKGMIAEQIDEVDVHEGVSFSIKDPSKPVGRSTAPLPAPARSGASRWTVALVLGGLAFVLGPPVWRAVGETLPRPAGRPTAAPTTPATATDRSAGIQAEPQASVLPKDPVAKGNLVSERLDSRTGASAKPSPSHALARKKSSVAASKPAPPTVDPATLEPEPTVSKEPQREQPYDLKVLRELQRHM